MLEPMPAAARLATNSLRFMFFPVKRGDNYSIKLKRL